MKLLLCGSCNDIRGLDPTGAATFCRCGNIEARWEDPHRGTVRVKAHKDRDSVRFIGLNNSFIRLVYDAPRHDHQHHKESHNLACDMAQGYLFHKEKRNCWAVVTRVGESNDIRWEDDPTQNPA